MILYFVIFPALSQIWFCQTPTQAILSSNPIQALVQEYLLKIFSIFELTFFLVASSFSSYIFDILLLLKAFCRSDIIEEIFTFLSGHCFYFGAARINEIEEA